MVSGVQPSKRLLTETSNIHENVQLIKNVKKPKNVKLSSEQEALKNELFVHSMR